MKLVLGTFDSEKYWRDPNWAKLPSIPDPERRHLSAVMDELLFPLLDGEDDLLLTGHAMNAAMVDYIRGLGFRGRYRSIGADTASMLANAEEQSVFERLCEPESTARFQLGDYALSPYSVLEHTGRMARAYGMHTPIPDYAVVRDVNSKLYSSRLIDELGLPQYGAAIFSAAELEEAAKRRLADDFQLLVKDPFGVSGSGNMLIAGESMLRRFVQHMEKQEANGKQVRLLLETFLPKQHDFSFHGHIHADGRTEPLGVQRMVNTQFSYSGSYEAEDDFLTLLDEKGYFSVMEQVMRHLARDGYFGHVCVDSMLLIDGELVPIVEINARQSMGWINHRMERHLEKRGLVSYLTFLHVGVPANVTFEQLLSDLDRKELLYTAERPSGIIPISSNTLFIGRDLAVLEGANRLTENRLFKGKWYLSLALRQGDEPGTWMTGVRQCLQDRSCKVYG